MENFQKDKIKRLVGEANYQDLLNNLTLSDVVEFRKMECSKDEDALNAVYAFYSSTEDSRAETMLIVRVPGFEILNAGEFDKIDFEKFIEEGRYEIDVSLW